jgi:hypothetical protein
MMVQSRFHKDDDGDPHEQILHIEAYIEELADVVESCRKIILVSKFAAAAGGILILARSPGEPINCSQRLSAAGHSRSNRQPRAPWAATEAAIIH